MTTLRDFWHNLIDRGGEERPLRQAQDRPSLTPQPAPDIPAMQTTVLDMGIPPDDPLVAYFQESPGVVEVDKLKLDSPAVRGLKAAGVRLVIPLVSQGELIGMINLGPRLSEQEYSSDDRKLLDDLAIQAAPAVRVAQLARQQQLAALERGRMEQELRIAGLIQQTLLPEDVPHLPGWEVSAFYRPAREVGGDFYEFLYFEDGRVGFIIGDVTDKGVPAALVMATTRTLLRASAERLATPGAVLERVNELLCPDIPQRMFVTCLYALLDPASGHMLYANAGHDLPYRRRKDGVDELRATGMPLGLMPGMVYEEKEIMLQPGETVLFHSDGLAEAHNPQREMFGFPRMQALMADHPGGETLIPFLLDELAAFTGPGWEQEDDVTLVVLQCAATNDQEQVLAEFSRASDPGNERQAMERVATAVRGLGLAAGRLEKLKTAVSEATMNAMEHGNNYQPDKPVTIRVAASPAKLSVHITDLGGDQPVPEAETPDLTAKLAGEQSPRGWGLFLIQKMVDEMKVSRDETGDGQATHTTELILNLEEGGK